MRVQGFLLATLALTVFVLSGCIQPLTPLVDATESVGEPSELPENLVFPGFEYRIDHPAGWTLFECLPAFAIAATEEDAEHWCQNGELDSLSMGFDHRSLSFMQSIGLPADATIDDLVAFNQREFDLEMLDETDTTIFGVPSRRVRSVNDDGVIEIRFAGFFEDEAFMLAFMAPTVAQLDENLPTIEAMVASLKSVSE